VRHHKESTWQSNHTEIIKECISNPTNLNPSLTQTLVPGEHFSDVLAMVDFCDSEPLPCS